jgi:hypothetical protein
MKKMLTGLGIGLVTVLLIAAASNYDRLVLGSGNYGTDPNPTADITLQNDEYISNYTNGTIDFGAAILATTGALNGGAQIAGIDSFVTTATADTIVLSGVATGDVFVFAEYTPNYSTAIDTITFQYRAKTDTVFVSRASVNNAAAYKSGALYSYIRIK